MQAEHAAADQLARASLDNSDHRIAIFDRIRELALLQGAAHPLPFARRDTAMEHETLGAAADAGDQGARPRLPCPGRPGLSRPQFHLAWSDRPQRPRAHAAACQLISIALVTLRP